jgi:hypothetical protein
LTSNHQASQLLSANQTTMMSQKNPIRDGRRTKTLKAASQGGSTFVHTIKTKDGRERTLALDYVPEKELQVVEEPNIKRYAVNFHPDLVHVIREVCPCSFSSSLLSSFPFLPTHSPRLSYPPSGEVSGSFGHHYRNS